MRQSCLWAGITDDIKVALEHASKGRGDLACKEASVHPTEFLMLFGNKMCNALLFKHLCFEK